MKTLLVCCICLAFLSPATPALTAAPEPKVKPIELRLALMIPPTHARWTLCMEPWIKMVEERTGGKIKIVPYFAETLAKSAEVYQATVRGISDMGEMVLEVVPGRFPLGISLYCQACHIQITRPRPACTGTSMTPSQSLRHNFPTLR